MKLASPTKRMPTDTVRIYLFDFGYFTVDLVILVALNSEKSHVDIYPISSVMGLPQ